MLSKEFIHLVWNCLPYDHATGQPVCPSAEDLARAFDTAMKKMPQRAFLLYDSEGDVSGVYLMTGSGAVDSNVQLAEETKAAQALFKRLTALEVRYLNAQLPPDEQRDEDDEDVDMGYEVMPLADIEAFEKEVNAEVESMKKESEIEARKRTD